MAIVHVRIDDRLIHGQVAMIWTNHLSATRIMVVDDEASKSDLIKMSLKLATPNGVSLSVLTLDKASERIKADAYGGQRVMLVIKSPENVLHLIRSGVLLEEVNFGNLSPKDATTKLSHTVSLSDKNIEAIKHLHAARVKLNMQVLPNDEKSEVWPL